MIGHEYAVGDALALEALRRLIDEFSSPHDDQDAVETLKRGLGYEAEA